MMGTVWSSTSHASIPAIAEVTSLDLGCALAKFQLVTEQDRCEGEINSHEAPDLPPERTFAHA